MNPNKPKRIYDVRGYKTKCINFQSCPLCYGCRRYSTVDPECIKCATNKKTNICNTDLHKSDLIGKMITKNTIVLDKFDFEDFK